MKKGVIMKTIVTILVVATIMTVATLYGSNLNEYRTFAHHWTSYYVENDDGKLIISLQELTILLNLVYFSFARSASTLRAQSITLHAATTAWQLYQNVVQTRRNPSKKIPYAIDSKEALNTMQESIILQQEHQKIGTSYANMLEAICKQGLINNDALNVGIAALRAQARMVLVTSLQTLEDYVKELIDACQQYKNDSLFAKEEPPDLNNEEVTRGIIDVLTNWLPSIAYYSFVYADRLSITASEESWRLLNEVQNMHNKLWETLETLRAQFYLVIYQTLFAIAQKHELVSNQAYIIFDTNGLIIDNTYQPLPNPTQLTIHAWQ